MDIIFRSHADEMYSRISGRAGGSRDGKDSYTVVVKRVEKVLRTAY